MESGSEAPIHPGFAVLLPLSGRDIESFDIPV